MNDLFRARRLLLALTLPAVLALSACGGAGTSSAGGGATGASPAADAECGTVPTVAPHDPDGLLAGLPETVTKEFNGWPDAVEASAWADLPDQLAAGPITVGFMMIDPGSPNGAGLSSAIHASADAGIAAGTVERLLDASPGSGAQVTPADQVRAYDDLVRQGADVIILQPMAGEAMIPSVTAAGEKGIPTVTFTGYVASPYAINLNPNGFDRVARSIARGAAAVGGKGDVVLVQGIEGMSVNTVSLGAAEQALAYCPDMKIAGTPAGFYNDAAAKGALLGFLASHPEPIGLVYQFASMGAGVFAAFHDAGREDRPLIIDNLPTAASLAWWQDWAADGYRGLAVSGTGEQFGDALWDIAMRTMRGEGPRINQIALLGEVITDENLAEHAVPGATTSDTGDARSVGVLMPAEYLDGYFGHPAR